MAGVQEVKNINLEVRKSPQEELVQLRHVIGDSVYITDPEGKQLEIKITKDDIKFIFTQDETGKHIAIEERPNGTKLYHISKDSTGLPSSHEIRVDQTEIVYFFNAEGNLQHFVELRANGDRVSTLMGSDGSIYSVEQKQIGGIIFQGWTRIENMPKEAMIWLHPDGDISTYGNNDVLEEILKRFTKFLDGVRVERR